MPQTIRAAALTHFAAVARAAGLNPQALLRSAGIAAASLANPDHRISAAAIVRLLESAAGPSGVEDFSLRLSDRWTISVLGPVALVMREQPTAREVVAAAGRYLAVHTDAGRTSIVDAGELTFLRVDLVGRTARSRQMTELFVGVLFRALKIYLPSRWAPLQVCFTHGPPRNRAPYAKRFGAPIEFHHAWNGLIVAASDLDTPIATSDPELARHARAYLDTLLERKVADTASRARDLVTMLLPTGRCWAPVVAGQLGVERRTMDRQIARSGTTFQTILDEVRRAQAAVHLAQEGRALSDVAALLGFASPAAFSRWFRREFGRSASAWRKMPR